MFKISLYVLKEYNWSLNGNFWGKEWQKELFTIKLLIILIVEYTLVICSVVFLEW